MPRGYESSAFAPSPGKPSPPRYANPFYSLLHGHDRIGHDRIGPDRCDVCCDVDLGGPPVPAHHDQDPRLAGQGGAAQATAAQG